MSFDDGIITVIEALYATATDAGSWPAALSALTTLMDSEAATFWVLTASAGLVHPLFTCVNLDPAFVQDYLAQGADIDPTVRYLIAHPEQAIVHDALVITNADKDRHPYFDWQSQHSDMRFRLVGQVHVAPGVQAGVALHRSGRKCGFTPADLDRFTLMYRHLEQALRISVRLGSLGAMQQWNMELLDAQPSAIILLDTSRRVIYTNASADALRASGDGIVFSRTGLSLLDPREDAVFQGLITQAVAGDAGQLASRTRAMRAARPSGRRAFGILVTAVGRSYPALSLVRPAACVIVTDPEAHPTPPHDILCSVFGLTSAEAALAARLAAGDDLKSAADSLGITYGTARTRLAYIFQKTDTRRQGELIRLLLTTLGGV